MEPTNRTTAGDQYSFGCVLYYVLSGQYPFGEGTAVEKMMAHQFKQPNSLKAVAPHVPDGMVAVVDRLMQKSPDARYPGVDEVAEALEPFAVEAVKGSRFGGNEQNLGRATLARSGGSHFGTSPGLPPTPVPAPAPQPTGYRVPATQFGNTVFETASAEVRTPPVAPQPPAPKRAPIQVPGRPQPAAAAPPGLPVAKSAPPPARPAPARPVPVPPSRERQKPLPVAVALPADVDDDVPVAEALPVALSFDDDGPATAGHSRRARRAPTYGKPSGTSTLFVILIAALVTVGMYVIGKTFIFAQ
jgi:serine/threonine-protein kinase